MKYKKIKIIYASFVGILCIFILLFLNDLNNEIKVFDTEIGEDKGNLVKIENSSDFYSITNGFIYFGRDSCPTCEIFRPILEETLVDIKKDIYYFDIDYFREKNILSEEALQEIFKKYDIISIPMVISLKNNEVDEAYGVGFVSEDQKENLNQDLISFLNDENPSVEKVFQTKYLTQYNIYILLFLMSIINLVVVFISKQKNNINYFFRYIILANISICVILILTTKSIINYLDYYILSGSIIAGFVSISIVIICMISSCVTLYIRR